MFYRWYLFTYIREELPQLGGHRYLALLPLMAHSPDRVWMMPVGRLDPPMVMGFVPSYCRIIRTRSLLSSVFGTTGALLTTWLYIAMESLLLSRSSFKGEPTGFICIKRLITAVLPNSWVSLWKSKAAIRIFNWLLQGFYASYIFLSIYRYHLKVDFFIDKVYVNN